MKVLGFYSLKVQTTFYMPSRFDKTIPNQSFSGASKHITQSSNQGSDCYQKLWNQLGPLRCKLLSNYYFHLQNLTFFYKEANILPLLNGIVDWKIWKNALSESWKLTNFPSLWKLESQRLHSSMYLFVCVFRYTVKQVPLTNYNHKMHLKAPKNLSGSFKKIL